MFVPKTKPADLWLQINLPSSECMKVAQYSHMHKSWGSSCSLCKECSFVAAQCPIALHSITWAWNINLQCNSPFFIVQFSVSDLMIRSPWLPKAAFFSLSFFFLRWCCVRVGVLALMGQHSKKVLLLTPFPPPPGDLPGLYSKGFWTCWSKCYVLYATSERKIDLFGGCKTWDSKELWSWLCLSVKSLSCSSLHGFSRGQIPRFGEWRPHYSLCRWA